MPRWDGDNNAEWWILLLTGSELFQHEGRIKQGRRSSLPTPAQINRRIWFSKHFTQLLIKSIFSRLAFLWTFSRSLQGVPTPALTLTCYRLLMHIHGFYLIWIQDLFFYSQSKPSQPFLSDSTLLQFNPPLLNFVHVYCAHICHQRFAKSWNFFPSLQKACITS